MHPNKQLFASGLKIILDCWSALNIAQENCAVDEDKKFQLLNSLLDYFSEYGAKVEPEELEFDLAETMLKEFNVILEDQSERHVARLLCQLYKESVKGEMFLLSSLQNRKLNQIQHIYIRSSIDENDSENTLSDDENLV